MSKYIFIRNDDVRHIVEPELELLFQMAENKKVPVTMAVEPENVKPSVVAYLLKKKSENPDLVELIQHGLNHNVHGQFPEGIEFGGTRDYQSQFEDLKRGHSLMTDYFGDKWTEILSFPYGSYNFYTLQALEDLKIKAITTSVSYSLKSFAKDLIGQLLNQQLIFGKKVSYHGKIRKPFSFWDLGVSVNFINKYLSYDTASHFDLEILYKKVKDASRHSDFVGILTHHRFHKAKDLQILDELIDRLKFDGFTFVTMASIIEILENRAISHRKETGEFFGKS